MSDAWRPLRRVNKNEIAPVTEAKILEMMRKMGIDRATAQEFAARNREREHWVNDLYLVNIQESGGPLVMLSIARRDGGPIFRDWRHFQNIKNDILGPECEAVELYPAESRMVDIGNKYHLIGCRDPNFRFPFGFTERKVDLIDKPGIGLHQRPA